LKLVHQRGSQPEADEPLAHASGGKLELMKVREEIRITKK